MRTSTCKGCGAEIVWCRTGRGKKMPLDTEPSADGVFVIEEEQSNEPLTRRLPNDGAATYTGPKYTAHWSTCPNADDFRKKRESSAD